MSILPDQPLACPQCKYDLRASAGPLCPECGTGFDREQLRERWSHRNRAPAWEARASIAAFAAVWWEVVFRPLRFARRYPALPIPGRARVFKLICYAIAAALVVLIGGPASGNGWIGPLAAFGGLVGMTICEYVLTGLLALFGPPKFAQPDAGSYPFWRGVCHYSAAFAILSGLWGAAGLVVHANWKFFGDELLWYAAAALIFFWWWVSVGVVVIVRARGAWRKLVGFALIPIVGSVSVCLGYGAAVVAAFASF